MEKLFTIDTLAENLGVSTRTIQRQLADGMIGHYRIGRQIKFSDKHVSDYLERIECHSV